MDSQRRSFLKAAAATGCLVPALGVSRLAYSAEANRQPLFVSLFLRGGADGLQLVAPAADPDYIAARPPELRVGDSGERAGPLLDNPLDAKAGFRFHPDAAPLASLYKARRLAVIHAVGLTDGTRSHFVAQDLVERGLSDEGKIAGTANGWLSRALGTANGRLPAYSATAAPVAALRGFGAVLTTPDVASGLSLPWGQSTGNLMRALGMMGTTPAHRASLETLDLLEMADRTISKDGAGKPLPYKPSGQASYDGAGELARSLSSVARLAKSDVGLMAAGVDHGGWDTHEGQPGRFANQVGQLSRGLAAFHEDMAASGRKVVIVVMTEFGRRLRANRSNGTDHGHGACWLVLGDRVQGGRMFGTWPGLATGRLDQGVDLAVTTDYRHVLNEACTACGLAVGPTLLDWKPTGHLGLFDAKRTIAG